MSFLGLFSFNAPYLPWVLFGFSIVLGNSATIDLIGIVVGHVYYFLEDVYPTIADIRGWQVRRWLAAPLVLKQLFGEVAAPVQVVQAPSTDAQGNDGTEPAAAEDAELPNNDVGNPGLGGEAGEPVQAIAAEG